MPRTNARIATVLFRDYVDPLMAGSGFTKRSRNYQFVDPEGARILVGFQASTGTTSGYEFYINVSLAPAAWVAYLQERRGVDTDAVLGSEWGLLKGRINPPEGFRWTIFDVESVPRHGVLIVSALAARIDAVKSLMDPADLLKRVQGNEPMPVKGFPPTVRLVLSRTTDRATSWTPWFLPHPTMRRAATCRIGQPGERN
jgi:hypothetical protein